MFNRYSYCLNNPLKYVYPSGNIVEVNGVDSRMLYDPNLIFVSGGGTVAAAASSEEGQAHEAARASNSEWVSQLEESSTVYEVVLPVSSTSTTQTLKYVSESLTYSVETQAVHFAAPEIPNDWNINLNFILLYVGTVGIMVNNEGYYPYGGFGISPTPFSVTLSVSNSNPTPGWNIEFQGNAFFGIGYGGAIDYNKYLDVIGMYDISEFFEWNIGLPGISVTYYKVFEKTW